MKQPLHILHLFGTYLPQTENWAYRLIRHAPDTRTFIAAKHYTDDNRFRDPVFTFSDRTFGNLEKRYERLRSNHPLELPEKIFLRLFKFPRRYLNDIARFASENKIDIVHAHFAPVAWFYRAIPRRLGVPFVVSFYGWDYERLPHTHPVYKKRYRQLFERADAFVCEGPHGASILRRHGCPEDKIHVIPLGIRPGDVPFYHRTKAPGRLRLVQVARFTEKKGFMDTVKAFHRALAEYPNLYLRLVGSDGTSEVAKAVHAYVRTHGLEAKVHITGPVPYEQLPDLLKDYHVFIQPSRYAADRDCEGGAPVTLLEAQATGMPVIATEHCDIPTFVADGQTGLLAPETDVDALARHIIRFCRMGQEEFDEFAHAARARVLAHYHIKQNATKLSDLYRQLMA